MVFDRLDDDERGVNQIDTLGGAQNMQTINESGLYNVVLRSDKKEAKPFRKWVTSVDNDEKATITNGNSGEKSTFLTKHGFTKFC